MFAVKGWNLDAASLKPQTTPFEVKADDPSKPQSRKRKRGTARDEDDVNKKSDAVSSQQLEGQKANKQKLKKQKQDKKARVTDTKHDSASTKQDQVQSSQKSKKKRDKSDAEKPAANLDTNGAREATTSKESTKPAKTKHVGNDVEKTSAKQQKTSQKQDVKVVDITAQSAAKLTPMQAAMRQKLISARFRHLNETLYTAPSQQAQELFDTNPNMFEEYHAGFRQQVAVWPENPVDKMLQKLRERGSIRLPNQKKAFKGKHGAPSAQIESPAIVNVLPRTKGVCTVADCGCGDARLAQTLKSSNDSQRLNLNILSYDLHSPSPHVTKADIAALPLADGSVDVVIFCLALMGTNWLAFIEEAYRVLRWKGELWIAEIKSRFGRVEKKGRVVEHSVGNRKKRAALSKAETSQRQARDEAAHEEALAVEVDGAETVKSESDIQEFLKALERRGFVLRNGSDSVDASNKMFVSMELIKAASPAKSKSADVKSSGPHKHKAASKEADIASDDEAKTLKPCLYKLR